MLSSPLASSPRGVDSFLAFAQHMCVRVQDRAEYRQKTADALVDLMSAVPHGLLARFVKFLVTLSRSVKAHHRQFAVELTTALLQHPELAMRFAPGKWLLFWFC